MIEDLNSSELDIITTYRQMDITDKMVVFRNKNDDKILWIKHKYLTKEKISDKLKSELTTE